MKKIKVSNEEAQKQGADKKIKIDDRQELSSLLIQRADEKTEAKFTDKYLDRENEKIKLQNGKEISIREIREIHKIIAQQLQEYEVMYDREYYAETFRLNGWEIPKGKIRFKPPIVGQYTNEIIYARFSKEVLPALQVLNPYIGFGLRLNKHFQWLTPEGKVMLETFIQDAIRFMKTCSTWYEFRIKHSKEFGLSFQLDVFKEYGNVN